MRKIFGLLIAIMILSIPAFADIRVPDPPKPKPTSTPKPSDTRLRKMHITIGSDAKIATLKIRRETFNQLRAAIDEAEGVQNPTAAGAFFNITPTQTVAGGLFLSLAFVFGGVFLARAKSRTPKIAVSLVALVVISAGAGVVLANTPPPSLITLTSRIFDKNTKAYGYADGNIRIQIIDREPGVYTGLDGTDVILEIPRAPGDQNSE